MAAIAFLGLGNMGGPMAKNLLAAGHSLTVFDLVEAACAAVAAEGASIAESAAEAAQELRSLSACCLQASTWRVRFLVRTVCWPRCRETH